MKTLFLTTLLLFSFPVIAHEREGGHSVGNGGDVVYCETYYCYPGGQCTWIFKNLEFLDIYEARELRKFKIDLGPKDLSPFKKVLYVLSKLEKFDKPRADKYEKWFHHLQNNTRFLSGIELTDVNDSNHLALPKNCKIKQIAVQRKPDFPEEFYYTISKDLWDKLDNDGKASLVLHEIIFREALALGQKNSINTRYVNGYISSKEMIFNEIRGYRERMLIAKFPIE